MDKSKGLEYYVDANWDGSWTQQSSHDPKLARSRTGFVIMFAGCPIVWKSTMQTLTALSTTEDKYIALSTALKEVIHIINLLNKLRERKFNMCASTPKIKCKVFEDNLSCIEMANHHKTRPRTKHLSVKFVVNNIINIEQVRSCKQIADILTKPLAKK